MSKSLQTSRAGLRNYDAIIDKVEGSTQNYMENYNALIQKVETMEGAPASSNVLDDYSNRMCELESEVASQATRITRQELNNATSQLREEMRKYVDDLCFNSRGATDSNLAEMG